VRDCVEGFTEVLIVTKVISVEALKSSTFNNDKYTDILPKYLKFHNCFFITLLFIMHSPN